MVDLTGHIAFGLLFAVPAWFLWHKRTAVAFVGLTAVASLLPDIDLWLQRFFPGEFHHHGVTHTVLFAVVAALVGGALVALLLSRPVDEWTEGERFDRSSLFVFSTLAFLLGGLSHVFADMLSAPDISTPIEPFWPFFEKPWSVDLLWYDAWWINAGFITVMIVVHIVLTYATTPSEHRYRIRRAA